MSDDVKVQEIGANGGPSEFTQSTGGLTVSPMLEVVSKVGSLLAGAGIDPDRAPEQEVRAAVARARPIIELENPELGKAWQAEDYRARLHGTPHYHAGLNFIVSALRPSAERERVEAEMQAQRVRDFAGTDPALGRYGLPDSMLGKYQPLRDNRGEGGER